MVVQGMPTQTSLRFWGDSAEFISISANGKKLKEEYHLSTIPLFSVDYLTAHLFELNYLEPNTEYTIVIKDKEGELSYKGKTLPNSLKSFGESGLQIALGSCYSLTTDSKQTFVHIEYPPLKSKPQFRLLVGDQIYNDVFTSVYTAINPFNPQNTFENYRSQWNHNNFKLYFKSLPNAVLPDDHEYWNNYPHDADHLWWLIDSRKSGFLKDCQKAFDAYQLPLNPAKKRSFSINFEELTFFVLDTRTERTRFDDLKSNFFNASDLLVGRDNNGILYDSFANWIKNLEKPGVLVLAGLVCDLPVGPTNSDNSLADYAKRFEFLWKSLINSKHDILVLAGDIHFNRFGFVELLTSRENPNRKGRIYELVSSPTALLDKHLFQGKEVYEAKGDNTFYVGEGSSRKKLFYNNIYPSRYMDVDDYPEDVSSFAIIDFHVRDEGIEFSLKYYNSQTKEILFNSKTFGVTEKLILY